MGLGLNKRFSSLFEGLKKHEIGRHVNVNTSNLHRTLFTSWNLLRGMFPGVPLYFNFYSDRQEVDLDKIEAEMNKAGSRTMGIAINVESEGKSDELMHQIKTAGEKANKFKKKNVHKCKLYKELENDPACIALLKKLWEMTGEECYDPSLPVLKRIAKIKKVANQMTIAKVHGMPVLPNVKGIVLTAADEALILKCAKAYWKYMYRPAKSDLVDDGIGRDGCGHLAGEIARHLQNGIDGKTPLRFVEFSAHDTTVLAMASLLGVDIEHPAFTGYWCFELHRPLKAGGQFKVAVSYNPHPTRDGIAVSSRQLPLDGKYQDWEALPIGTVDAAELIKYMGNQGAMESAALLKVITQLAEAVKSGDKTWADVLSMASDDNDATCKKYREAFDFYDGDSSGKICVEELGMVFKRLGLDSIHPSVVKELITFFDSNNADGTKDGQLDFTEFKAMMTIVKKNCKSSKETKVAAAASTAAPAVGNATKAPDS